ncbi:MAG: acyl-CoA/acyl-ACP dehydrogenase [Proteobacteria bacterium]|jgi:alkylation response protein AidB-like acyl-CoA dehydrogenase|nr:acyl-CoA/acyl-ACP dehydrogenase [Pseudomonadota bacterium]MDA1299799.1 acyl-CoA/acyl-ACP dehydrogenase [Pseudomonadota bacterium]
MNFGFTEEQELLREQVRKFLEERCPTSTVRSIMNSDAGYSSEHWSQMAALGWLGLMIDESHEGVGLGWIDLIVVLEEMGRSLCPTPFVSHCLTASTLCELGNEEQKKTCLPGLASGDTIGTIAVLDIPDDPIADNLTLQASADPGGIILTGTKPFVTDAGSADLFLVAYRHANKPGLAIVRRQDDGVSASSTATMDLTKRTGTLTLENVKVPAAQLIPMTEAQLIRLLDKGVVAVTAEMVGAAEAIIEMTTSYARERIQFGHPIGKYQGVKHRLAEMYVDVESFKSLAYFAAWCVDEDPDQLPRAASLAKAYASDAFAQMGIDGVQLHGAIGFTQEYDIQLYLKRSKWARPMFGDADYHYERVAALTL